MLIQCTRVSPGCFVVAIFLTTLLTSSQALARLDPQDVCPVKPPCYCVWEDDFTNYTLHALNCSSASLRQNQLPVITLDVAKYFFVRVNYSHNLIDDLPSNYFDNIQLTLYNLDLSYNHLASIPTAVRKLTLLMELSLQGNHLHLSESDKPFRNLRLLVYLDLSDNRISSLPERVFQGLSKLEYLLLDKNSISEIDGTVFSDTPLLKQMSLKANKIESLGPDGFGDLQELTSLDLSKNSIQTIQPGALAGLPKLKKLKLILNPDIRLNNQTFAGLSSLTYLDLSANRLVELPPDLFTDASSLDTLILGANRLTTFRASWLHGAEKSLRALLLSYNFIPEFPPNAFISLTNLHALSLSGNPLTHLPDISVLGQLRILGISGTSISTLYPCDLYHQHHLTHLSWSNSPITCDCNLRWLAEKVAEDSLSPVKPWTCRKPEQLAGEQFRNLVVENLTCSTERRPRWCRHSPAANEIGNASLVMSVKDVSPTSAVLVWNATLIGSAVSFDHVTIVCTPSDANKEERIFNVSYSLHETILTALDSHATYEVCIECYGISRIVLAHNCTELQTTKRPVPRIRYLVPVAVALVVVVAVVAAGMFLWKHRIVGRIVRTPNVDGFGEFSNPVTVPEPELPTEAAYCSTTVEGEGKSDRKSVSDILHNPSSGSAVYVATVSGLEEEREETV